MPLSIPNYRGEIGMASISLRHPTLQLFQFADSQTYVKSITQLQILSPIEIIFPSTMCDTGNMAKVFRVVSDNFQVLCDGIIVAYNTLPQVLLTSFPFVFILSVFMLNLLEYFLTNGVISSEGTSNLKARIYLLQNSNITTVQRHYFNEGKGLDYIKQLCIKEQNSVQMDVQAK